MKIMDYSGLTVMVVNYLRLKYDSELTEVIQYCVSDISRYNTYGKSQFVPFSLLVRGRHW
jgi:hypothetical protein